MIYITKQNKGGKMQKFTEKMVGYFLLIILLLVGVYKFDYIAIAILPALLAPFPVLWYQDSNLSFDNLKKMDKKALVTYGIALAGSLIILAILIIIFGEIDGSWPKVCWALAISLVNMLFVWAYVIPFVCYHGGKSKYINWMIYWVVSLAICLIAKIYNKNDLLRIYIILFPLAIFVSIFIRIICPKKEKTKKND